MKKNNAYLLLLLLPFFVLSQELPPIENYTSKEYGAENQNWRIFQSDERNIYVANNSGLLEFNGAKWKLYPSPNNTILRSVNVVGSKVYTGCYMEFGYWERNEFGSLKYESLSKKIKESLIEEDFWNILNLDNWILFQSLNRIYIYNTLDETFKIINSKTQLPKIFKVGESVYFQKMEEGKHAGIIAESKALLDQNGAKETVITTASGLQYEILQEGSGKQPTATSKVTVHYHGTTPDGTVFDSSVDRGEPISFALNQVIRGWTEGVQLMKEGAKYRFTIPENLAYGANPRAGGPIKPYMALVFEVELIKVED